MRAECPHCPGGLGLEFPLFEDDLFWIVCDAHPLVEGHILLIPKEHVTCMGALNDASFERYKELYKKTLNFLKKTYGHVGIFEHGIVGQTVFHAHTHFLPFEKPHEAIVPEKESVRKISRLDQLKKHEKYLFFALDDEKVLVDISLGFPRFFRDRFAKALGAEERGNWKKARQNNRLMKDFKKDISELTKKWNLY